MLPYRSHWHIAFERNPEREARFLWNNNTPAGSDSSANDPLQTQTGFAGAGIDAESTGENGTAVESSNTAEQTEATIQNEQQETRAATQNVLEGQTGTEEDEQQEENRITANEISERTEALTRKVPALMKTIKTLRRMLKDFPVAEEEQEGIKKLREGWERIYDELQSLLGSLTAAQQKAAALKRWVDGDVPPDTFLNWLADERKDPNSDEDEEDPQIAKARVLVQSTEGSEVYNAEEGVMPDITTEELWRNFGQTYGSSTKIEAVRTISDIVDIDQEINAIHNLIAPLESILENDKLEERAENTLAQLMQTEGTTDAGNPIGFTIEWYSLMDFYNGAKGWYEDWKKAFENRANLRKSKLQYKFARATQFFPYGKDTLAESERSLDGTHRTRRNELKESLDNEKPLFTEMFGKGARFQLALSKKDPDNIMAILEYAADRGWLYTLKEEGYLMDGVRLINQKQAFPNHWDERRIDLYLDNLVGQNQSGYNKEKDASAESVKRRYTIQPDFLRELDGYLNQINIPAAHGVMEALLARAIDGDEDTKIAVHFFRALRAKPEIQQYLTDSIIQTISTSTAGKATLAMTNLFMDRGALSKEARKAGTQNQSLQMKDSGNLAKAIAIAEEKILAQNSSITQESLDKAVSDVLVGKPVIINGTTISIWEKEFDFYRSSRTNIAMRFTNAEGVKNTEIDYYNSEDTYEMLMTNKAFLTELFRTESARKWVNPDQARAFVGKILIAYKDMREKYADVAFEDASKNPAERMRLELKEKIEEAMKRSIGMSENLVNIDLSVGGEESIKTLRDKTAGAVAALEVMGFIELATMGDEGKKLLRKVQPEIDELLRNPQMPRGGRFDM